MATMAAYAPNDTADGGHSSSDDEPMDVVCEEWQYTFEFELAFPEQLRREVSTNPLRLAEQSEADGEICKFYLKGSCMKGNDCPYKHHRGDKAVVCKHWLRGLCKKGNDCEFLHKYDLKKMPPCYFFSRYGECSNAECLYRHVNPEENVKECPWYAQGFCKHGPRCRHKHVKKQACERYLIGFCPDGPNCKFGHPKYETQADEQDKNRVRSGGGGTGGGGYGGYNGGGGGGSMDHDRGDRGDRGERMANKAQGSTATARPLEEVTCFKCGQKGHYANKCQNKRVQPPPGGYQLPSTDAPGGGGGGANVSAGASQPPHPSSAPPSGPPQFQAYSAYQQQTSHR